MSTTAFKSHYSDPKSIEANNDKAVDALKVRLGFSAETPFPETVTSALTNFVNAKHAQVNFDADPQNEGKKLEKSKWQTAVSKSGDTLANAFLSYFKDEKAYFPVGSPRFDSVADIQEQLIAPLSGKLNQWAVGREGASQYF